MTINEAGLKHYADDVALKRYSVRYELGDARVLSGMSVEPSVLLHPENSGKTLDEVCQTGEPFYPQCWPIPREPEEQERQMQKLVVEKFPFVGSMTEKVLSEVRSYYGMIKKE
jgi:hypothetical protein